MAHKDEEQNQEMVESREEKEDQSPISNLQSPGDDAVQKLEQELNRAKKAQEEMLGQTQRALADYANLKKRFEREREEVGKFAGEMVLMELLPSIDNLERAVFHASEEDKKSGMYQGLVMTLQQLEQALSGIGLKRLEVKEGEEFDPHKHEAVEMVAGPKEQIVTVLEPGYMLHEKLVRPARVKVGSGEEVKS